MVGTPDTAGAAVTPATGRPCLTCKHPERGAIDRALLMGENLSTVSTRYGIARRALLRHQADHLPVAARQEAAQAVAETEARRGSGLLHDASTLRNQAISILDAAKDENDHRTALMAIREAIRCLELMAKLSGDLDPSTTINVFTSPAFLTVQVAIVQALEPHPTAKAAVIAALESVR